MISMRANGLWRLGFRYLEHVSPVRHVAPAWVRFPLGPLHFNERALAEVSRTRAGG